MMHQVFADVTAGNENAANATFTVSLSAASGKDITVDYATSMEQRQQELYTATSGTLTISAGATSGTFNVPVLADTTDENNETATITLSNASNASISDSTATLTITDDDAAPTIEFNDIQLQMMELRCRYKSLICCICQNSFY